MKQDLTTGVAARVDAATVADEDPSLSSDDAAIYSALANTALELMFPNAEFVDADEMHVRVAGRGQRDLSALVAEAEILAFSPVELADLIESAR